jgi:UDP-N-acetylmuramoyl-L-alanyl-D-glutamate--2,6-diaminopimelate ligase
VDGEDRRVTGLAIDSRRVTAGDLFAALPGSRADGRAFIAEAQRRGAAALLLPADPDARPSALELPCLLCARPRAAASHAAQLLAGDPTASLTLLGVTGTNGKSTCVHLLQHLLGGEGESWGLLGTLHFDAAGSPEPSTHTTPDPVSLARLLAASLAAGRVGVIMEVSSHALDQDRVAGCRFAGALYTNLSRDHLDYHGDMARYLAAKTRLLEHLAVGAPVLANADDDGLAPLRAGSGDRLLTYGHAAGADYRIEDAVLSAGGSCFVLRWAQGRAAFATALPGPFNLMNAAGSLALALARGADPARLAARLPGFAGVAGRMESLALPGGPRVIIDFAHSPDAVQKVLAACRSLLPPGGRLIALLGAGGDRDRGKRPLMAAALQAGADLAILTSDNPRSEDPERILDEMAAGLDASRAPWRRVTDRWDAIALALAESRPADLVVILGKGHETTQEIAERKLPFIDREVAASLWRERGGAA